MTNIDIYEGWKKLSVMIDDLDKEIKFIDGQKVSSRYTLREFDKEVVMLRNITQMWIDNVGYGIRMYKSKKWMEKLIFDNIEYFFRGLAKGHPIREVKNRRSLFRCFYISVRDLANRLDMLEEDNSKDNNEKESGVGFRFRR